MEGFDIMVVEMENVVKEFLFFIRLELIGIDLEILLKSWK